MNLGQTLRRLRREWLVALVSYALMVAPFGCQFQLDLFGGGGNGGSNLTTSSAGFFLNQDASDALLAAGRNAAGDAFFVYGTHTDSGGVGEVESILIKTAAGASSFIMFESGRPVHLEDPNGNYVHIKYDEISTARLAVTADVHDAAAGTTETQSVDVDLTLTAAQVAQAVSELTGQSLEAPSVSTDAAKMQHRALGGLLTTLLVLPMVLLTELMIIIMGQVMQAIFLAVTLTLPAVVLAAFAPLFLFAALFNDVAVTVELVPLLDIFIELPSPPEIDITLR